MKGLFAIFILPAVPALLGRRPGAPASAKGRGRVGAVALAFGLAFSTAFDPPQRAAIEDIRKGRVGRLATADGAGPTEGSTGKGGER